MKKKIPSNFLLLIITILCNNSFYAQDFKIIEDNWTVRRKITDTIQSGNFILGINSNGGGYITGVSIPEIGNTMGIQAQRYGRGGQSSIRDGARGGQYNPTQAGFSDEGGTVCTVIKSKGKIVIPSRGCALYNGDGHFDYTRWENIVADHPKIIDNNNDQDNIDEENLSILINGKTFTKQAAEVHSDFDFYGEYENVKNKSNLKIPAIRHYLEYRFIRSSTMPNSAMKQFNIPALDAVGEWLPQNLATDISTLNPSGLHPGSITNMNNISLSWSIRTDVAIWNPIYRYAQKNDGSWLVAQRSGTFKGSSNIYKLRFIVADSNNENEGHALGFYRPETELNNFNVVGIIESNNSEVYKDNRTTESFYLDIPKRTPSMSWIGFRSKIKGLLDRSIIANTNPGVYEKLRQETILLYGTPAEIKIAFKQLDNYYKTLSTPKFSIKKKLKFEIYPNPSNSDVHLKLNTNKSKIEVFNSLGVKILESFENSRHFTIPKEKFITSGFYLIKVNGETQKIIVN